MKRGQLVTGRAIRCDYPCKARVECEEGIVSVKNALPGQKVSVRIGRSRNGSAEGTLVEVLERSELETNEICAHFGECGGCAYLSLRDEEEARIKGEQILRLLSSRISESTRLFGEEPVWDGIKDSPVKYGYRNKMEFSFGNDRIDGPLNVGLHKRGAFHDVLDACDCRIVDEDYRKLISATRDYFRKENTPFYRKKDHTGYLRNLLVRKAAHTGEMLVCPVTASGAAAGFDDTALLEGYCEELKSLSLDGSLKGIIHIICDSLSDAVIPDRCEILYGTDHINETLLDLNFRIGPFSFFQTNTYSAEVLYSLVRDYVSMCGEGADGKTVFDLYSGTGTIAQIAARNASKVVGVEIVEEAVAAARKNASENGIANCEFICGDVLKVIDEIEDKPDIIILDPPRDGIHPKALPKILDHGVDHIVYISCKPTSLERDLGPVMDAGYRIKRLACVNQFPWTKEVETICLLGRN
ncbi:MAG: 23S rRNA (uracil(1939)-C(5))-methyltransferase RlmD [Lachnospiraceae bacterium]|nr:23S rRNA (uracil(1939)-C(5))-methyltransferase RlmD [Lachnospiraceae bacterium]